MVLQSPSRYAHLPKLFAYLEQPGRQYQTNEILTPAPSLLSCLVPPGGLCRVLENGLQLPLAAQCRNTTRDSCISPQLTLAETYISLHVQWPPTPSTNTSRSPKGT